MAFSTKYIQYKNPFYYTCKHNVYRHKHETAFWGAFRNDTRETRTKELMDPRTNEKRKTKKTKKLKTK